MKIGPRYKIAKRLGASVFEKTQTQKFQLSEERSSQARHRGRRPRSLSNYGRQLLEKQRARFTYGITERQLSRYAGDARKQRNTSPAERLYQILETRLDNVVYRLGLASTRRGARQMVSHGHIVLNGTKTTVPSAAVRSGDSIAVRENSRDKALFSAHEERIREHQVPSWLTFDSGKLSGSVAHIPTLEAGDVAFDLGDVLEFYSK